MNGILNLDKPSGMTSHDCLYKLRRIFATRRIGHAGTLDPLATGVLPVMVGNAVKCSEYLTEHDKRYCAVLKLGVTSDTQDITGTLVPTNVSIPSLENIQSVLGRFTGEISQIPPMHSAIKVDGKKLYELARKGIEIERSPRQVTIYSLSILPTQRADEYELDISCSKGTYIRTLCADIGDTLGCGGVMASLRRTECGSLDAGQSLTLEQLAQLKEQGGLEGVLIPVEDYFSTWDKLSLEPFFSRLAKNGAEIYINKI